MKETKVYLFAIVLVFSLIAVILHSVGSSPNLGWAIFAIVCSVINAMGFVSSLFDYIDEKMNALKKEL